MEWTDDVSGELSDEELAMLEIGWLDLWFAYRDEAHAGQGDDG